MPDIPEPKDLVYILAILSPGFIFLYFRSRFITGHTGEPNQFFLYLVLSSIYYAAFFPIYQTLLHIINRNVLDFTLYFAIPAALGVCVGVLIRNEWPKKVLASIGLKVVHGIPTAWDFKFGSMHGEYVVITLKDDTVFRGFLGERSFISTVPSERDIYVEKVFDVDENGNWTDIGQKALLIYRDEVKTVEFIPM